LNLYSALTFSIIIDRIIANHHPKTIPANPCYNSETLLSLVTTHKFPG